MRDAYVETSLGRLHRHLGRFKNVERRNNMVSPMKETELQLIEKMEKSNKLVSKRYEEFQRKYGNEFVALDNGELLAHNQNLDVLKKYLERKKKELNTVLIEYIPEKGVAILY